MQLLHAIILVNSSPDKKHVSDHVFQQQLPCFGQGYLEHFLNQQREVGRSLWTLIDVHSLNQHQTSSKYQETVWKRTSGVMES